MPYYFQSVEQMSVAKRYGVTPPDSSSPAQPSRTLEGTKKILDSAMEAGMQRTRLAEILICTQHGSNCVRCVLITAMQSRSVVEYPVQAQHISINASSTPPAHYCLDIGTLHYFQIGRNVISKPKRSIPYLISSLIHAQKASSAGLCPNGWVSISYHSRSRSLLVVLRSSSRICRVSTLAYPASPSSCSSGCSPSLSSLPSSPRKSSLSSFPPLMNSVQPHPTRAMPPNTPQASNSPLCCKRIDNVNRPPDAKGPKDRPAAERVWAMPLSEPRVS